MTAAPLARERRREQERRALLARRLREVVVLLRPGQHPEHEALASQIRFRIGWILTEYLGGE